MSKTRFRNLKIWIFQDFVRAFEARTLHIRIEVRLLNLIRLYTTMWIIVYVYTLVPQNERFRLGNEEKLTWVNLIKIT